MATATEANALGYNLKVDYVIHYSFGDSGMSPASVAGKNVVGRPRPEELSGVVNALFPPPDQAQAIAQLEKLLRTLANVGLQSEVRQGDETSLLVFVRASKRRLNRAVYRSR